MTNFGTLTDGLQLSASGVWVSHKQSSVSYPEDGNETVFEIEEDSFWFRHRNLVIESLIRQFSGDELFYDIGGGNGCISKWLQDNGVDTVLLEPGPDGVSNAKLRGVEQIIHSTLEEAHFHDGVIAAAGMFDVLEHIESDEQVLSTLHQKMSPGGRLYLTVPALRALWSIEDDYAGHYRRYTLGQLRKVLEKTGFEVKYESYLFSFLVLPVFVFRSLPSLLKLRKTVEVAKSQQEHTPSSSLTRRLVDLLLGSELKRVEGKKKIHIGSSCLVVAKKG